MTEPRAEIVSQVIGSLLAAPCAVEREDGKVDVVDMPPSIEALARADAFLAALQPTQQAGK